MKHSSRDLLYPNADVPVVRVTTIGHRLSPEHRLVLERLRREQIRRLDERRRNRD